MKITAFCGEYFALPKKSTYDYNKSIANCFNKRMFLK